MTQPTVTRAEEIRQILAEDIVRGQLPPGISLDESEIARRFGVSRTPVREAIRQLEAEGLAHARPRRGAVVAVVTRKRLDEMFLVMLELEALCAREAARNMTADERAALEALQAQGGPVAASDDQAAYYLHNLTFHDAIYAGAHNAYLAETTLAVRKRLAPFRRAQFAGENRVALSHLEHGTVLAAILQNNAEAAAATMRAHIQVVRAAYETMMPGHDTGGAEAG